MGPFYPIHRPLDEDQDLTRTKGVAGRAQGRLLDLHGRVIDSTGKPVIKAQIELWQANTFGRYAHISDPNTTAPLDPAFQGFSKQRSDRDGRFRVLTVIPGPYPFMDGDTQRVRTPHIHFDICGTHDRLVTQVYFDDQPLNQTDLLYQALSPSERETVTLHLRPGTVEGEPVQRADWLVVLASG